MKEEIEEIVQLIQEAERVGAIKIMTPVECLRWQNERIEELEKAINEIADYSTCTGEDAKEMKMIAESVRKT